MAELKTQKTDKDPREFIASLGRPAVEADCEQLIQLFEELTGDKAELWGTNIVAFGTYTYDGGKKSWFKAGFSPRKTNLTLYMMTGWESPALERIGKYTKGVGCLHIKNLAAVDSTALRELISDRLEFQRVTDMGTLWSK